MKTNWRNKPLLTEGLGKMLPTAVARRPRTAAFSLVELAICVLMAAIVIEGVYKAMATQYKLVQVNTDRLRAEQIVIEKLDVIRLYTWDQVTNSSVLSRAFTATFNNTNSVANSSNVFSGTVMVANLPTSGASYSANLVKVTVQVTWTNSLGALTSSASTYVSQYGLHNYIYQ